MRETDGRGFGPLMNLRNIKLPEWKKANSSAGKKPCKRLTRAKKNETVCLSYILVDFAAFSSFFCFPSPPLLHNSSFCFILILFSHSPHVLFPCPSHPLSDCPTFPPSFSHFLSSLRCPLFSFYLFHSLLKFLFSLFFYPKH